MRTWLLALAACGNSSSAAPDGPVDTAIDSPPDGTANTLACTPTSATGQVTVDGPSGATNVTFIVHDPSGAIVSRSAAMGSDATVMLDVPSCGMVSVYSLQGTRPQVVTWTNVQPGDHLISLDRDEVAVDHDVSVVIPEQTGATGYDYFAACSKTRLTVGNTSDPGAHTLTAHCPPAATSISVVAVPMGASSPAPMSFLTVAFAASGTTTVTLPAYQALPATTITAHGVTGYVNAFFAAFTTTSEAIVAEASGIVAVAGSDASFVTGTLPGMGAVDVELVSNKSAKSARLVRSMASIPSAVDFEATDMLPVPTASIDAATTRPTVVWSAPGSTAATAIFEIDIGPNASHVEWDVVAPPVPGAFQLPEMPVDLVPVGQPFLRAAGLLDMSGFTTYHAGDLSQIFTTFPPIGGQSRFSTSDNGLPPAKPSFVRWRRR